MGMPDPPSTRNSEHMQMPSVSDPGCAAPFAGCLRRAAGRVAARIFVLSLLLLTGWLAGPAPARAQFQDQVQVQDQVRDQVSAQARDGDGLVQSRCR